MLGATGLVLMMTIPGLALFYGGLVRSKNMLSVLMQVFVIFALIVLLWAIYGYSFAFTEGNAFIGGTDRITNESRFTPIVPKYLAIAVRAGRKSGTLEPMIQTRGAPRNWSTSAKKGVNRLSSQVPLT